MFYLFKPLIVNKYNMKILKKLFLNCQMREEFSFLCLYIFKKTETHTNLYSKNSGIIKGIYAPVTTITPLSHSPLLNWFVFLLISHSPSFWMLLLMPSHLINCNPWSYFLGFQSHCLDWFITSLALKWPVSILQILHLPFLK